jgi:hypothetical protein
MKSKISKGGYLKHVALNAGDPAIGEVRRARDT